MIPQHLPQKSPDIKLIMVQLSPIAEYRKKIAEAKATEKKKRN